MGGESYVSFLSPVASPALGYSLKNNLAAMKLMRLGLILVAALLANSPANLLFRLATPFPQTLLLAQTVTDQKAKADQLLAQGKKQIQDNQFTAAIESCQQALAIYRQIDERRGEGYALLHLAIAYTGINDSGRAIEYQERSLVIAREIEDEQLQEMAQNSVGESYSLQGEKMGALAGEWIALNQFGLMHLASGNLAEAEEMLREAITIQEANQRILGQNDDWKVSVFDAYIDTYYHLQEVLIASNKPDEALAIAERGRARILVELLSGRLSSQTIEPPNLEEIRQIASEQNATIVEYSLIPSFSAETFAEQEYSRQAKLYIWVIQPDGEITFRSTILPEDAHLQKLVASSRLSIGVKARGSSKSDSPETNSTNSWQELHQLLIEPIAGILPQNEEERIIFIPHQELFLVPFTALQDNNNKYLIEKHTILTAPSIQSLSLTRQHRQRVEGLSGEALVVGNPTMPAKKVGQDAQPLSSLPGAEKEAKSIAKMLNTEAFIGNQATEPAIVRKMTRAKIIHLATHGLLDDINGVGSPGAIVLASSDNDDGFLTSGEIMEQYGLPNTTPLQAELVVLSACDTGSGDIKG
ncbi:MAG: CHAT domain-containing protein, partial [Symploca sp. SIO2D2]|nr:CHAT domain-containing protein [Symploca sp. SIO2D2]